LEPVAPAKVVVPVNEDTPFCNHRYKFGLGLTDALTLVEDDCAVVPAGFARTEIRIGERVPDTVEIESFPDEVYRESPSLREYRYIHRDNRTYVVEPQERRIIEEID
jgi:Protein of unknown function (DUF1236)